MYNPFFDGSHICRVLLTRTQKSMGFLGEYLGRVLVNSVSKCSATLASVAAPPLGARQGFGGPNYPRHPLQVGLHGMGATGVRDGVRQGPLGG